MKACDASPFFVFDEEELRKARKQLQKLWDEACLKSRPPIILLQKTQPMIFFVTPPEWPDESLLSM